MGIYRRSIIAAVAFAAGPIAQASAGGLTYPTYKAPVPEIYNPVAVPAPAPIPEVVDWYFRGDISFSWFQDPDGSDASGGFIREEIDKSWAAGGGVGYYFNEHIRGDLTLEYLFDADFIGVDPTTDSTHNVNIESLVGLANIYIDFLPREDITPYIGGGIGFVNHETDTRDIAFACPCPPTGTTSPGEDNVEFAAALMAGVSWTFHKGLLLDANYRYLHMGEAKSGPTVDGQWTELDIGDIDAHQFRIGLRYELY